MSDTDDNKPEPRQIINQDVDPYEAGWDPIIAFRGKFKYRVFFENDIGLKNGLQMDLLRGWLEDNCGTEGEDWELVMSDTPMEDYWNKGRTGTKEEQEALLYGNNVYLKNMAWLISQKLIQDPNSPDAEFEAQNKHTGAKITVIQTRQ